MYVKYCVDETIILESVDIEHTVLYFIARIIASIDFVIQGWLEKLALIDTD